MHITYITNSTRVNADLATRIISNDERGDAALTLYIAPAYQRGTTDPMIAAYIASNGDPYALAMGNKDGEIFFGHEAFGGPADDLSCEFAEWLTPEALEDWVADSRQGDNHFVLALAEALRTARAADTEED